MKSNIFTIEYENLASFADFISDSANSENFQILDKAIENFLRDSSNNQNDEECDENLKLLLLRGDTATGKTHLLEAIAKKIHAQKPSATIIHGQASKLVPLFAETKNQMRKIAALDDVDVLLLDDLHLLANKVDLLQKKDTTETSLNENVITQNELAKYLDSLLKKKSLVVLSYSLDNDYTDFVRNKNPMRLDDGLYSRLFYGVTLNLPPPSLNILTLYAQRESEKNHLSFTKSMCLTLARFSRDIRQLQGLIKTISSYVKVQKGSFGEEGLANFLKNFEGKKEITAEGIISYTAQYFQVQLRDIKGKSRMGKHVLARQISMFLCRQLLGFSFPKIAQAYGGKDHTTVIYACTKVEKDPYLLEIAKELSQNIMQESSTRRVKI